MSPTFATQSRSASLSASRSVPLPGRHGTDLGAEQVHAPHVRRLALHVGGAHVDDALETEQRAHGGGRHPVLTGARLGHDPRLADPLREQPLAEGVVDLVGAGVRQILALEEDADVGRAPLGNGGRRDLVQRRGPADEVALEPRQLRAGRRGRAAPRSHAAPAPRAAG